MNYCDSNPQRFFPQVDQYITHRFDGIDAVNDAIHALHSGDCLRAVVRY